MIGISSQSKSPLNYKHGFQIVRNGIIIRSINSGLEIQFQLSGSDGQIINTSWNVQISEYVLTRLGPHTWRVRFVFEKSPQNNLGNILHHKYIKNIWLRQIVAYCNTSQLESMFVDVRGNNILCLSIKNRGFMENASTSQVESTVGYGPGKEFHWKWDR